MRKQPLDLGGTETTEAETEETSGYEANESEGLPSGCDETIDKLSSIIDRYNLEGESEILKRQLEKKEEVLVKQIRYQLREIEKLSPSFYSDLLQNSEVKFSMVDHRALGKDAAERLYVLLDIESKLRNAKNEIKRDSSTRRSARQMLKPKRSFKDC